MEPRAALDSVKRIMTNDSSAEDMRQLVADDFSARASEYLGAANLADVAAEQRRKQRSCRTFDSHAIRSTSEDFLSRAEAMGEEMRRRY
jgi:hypothetical protein